MATRQERGGKMTYEAGHGRFATPALQPSEYTAALIQVLRERASLVAGACALEIGSGSGVVLAALGDLGAESLDGVDIEPEAISAGSMLLDELGYEARTTLHRGDMWTPVADRRFDLIVANLPHFPMPPGAVGARLPSWSAGGTNGRRFLDPFLAGLSDHLATGARAFVTHNAFVDLDVSRDQVRACGLEMRVASTQLVYIPDEKLARMTPGVLAAAEGRSIHRYGVYAFGEVHIMEIAEPGQLD